MAKSPRHLVLILGDQLNLDSSALADFDPTQDIIWMAEVMEESTHVASSKQRSTLFLSAMRHFAEAIKAKAWPLVYTQLSDADNTCTLAGELDKAIQKIRPQKLLMTAPGEWRVLQSLRAVAKNNDLALDVRDCKAYEPLQKIMTWHWTFGMTRTSLAPCVTLQSTPRAANNCAKSFSTASCVKKLAS